MQTKNNYRCPDLPEHYDSHRSRSQSGLKTFLSLITGAGIGIVVYELLRRGKALPVFSSSTSLVDTIKVTENGMISRIMTFGWNDDEMCSWARNVTLDANGNVSEENLIEIEYGTDSILISERYGEEDTTPVLYTVLLDEYGMTRAVTRRSRSGRETRMDGKIRGAELKHVSSGEATYDYEWADGNVQTISSKGEVVRRMTYYKSIEIHLFPDLNFLALGLSPNMLLTHLLGLRTRNFLSTLEVVNGDKISHYSFSYLFDSEDRPLQIHQELVTLDTKGEDKIGIQSRADYDIKYLVR